MMNDKQQIIKPADFLTTTVLLKKNTIIHQSCILNHS